ncbi:hypothetical protein SAMN05216345_110160 [Cupriavidus sp. YR651]|uniref:hypothetical protein n=1 Tax=Cupriavidus sp. YR651 TaxID=1855315 RepID=UPI00087FEAD9|nr:hypothetical protein [Cupriavidus sp. YR651]SDD52856.1 hypothetical protein SAMN05216345_110160 [Cupriavidus sp. YR651]
MKSEVVLYHDGCKVCLAVVDAMTGLIDSDRHDLTVINLAASHALTAQAEAAGVKRLPSLVIDGKVIEVQPHAPVAEFREEPMPQ